jgi:hypothetical protein
METTLIKSNYWDNFNMELYIKYLQARIAKM